MDPEQIGVGNSQESPILYILRGKDSLVEIPTPGYVFHWAKGCDAVFFGLESNCFTQNRNRNFSLHCPTGDKFCFLKGRKGPRKVSIQEQNRNCLDYDVCPGLTPPLWQKGKKN